MKPRLLDLFCGAGGAAVGYARAGFDVVGVDIKPQPRYPFEFHQADALDVLQLMTLPSPTVWAGMPYLATGFDAIHASPPCQDWSRLAMHDKRGSGWLLAATRELLQSQSLPWVLENVEGSGLAEQPDLMGANGLLLCGAMFKRKTYRHRLMESSLPLVAPSHPRHLVPASKAGHYEPGTWISVAGNCAPIGLAREAMAIDWMNREEMAEAIPPYFTEYIGAQLRDHLQAGAA
jgi:DNA (cytosine-5)-methyltransferase 1